eukprot:m.102700 g.102700  ORF g.102700 m.102700 type:complete len:485 (-) comp15698_c0_seq1:400-1854(-)
MMCRKPPLLDKPLCPLLWRHLLVDNVADVKVPDAVVVLDDGQGQELVCADDDKEEGEVERGGEERLVEVADLVEDDFAVAAEDVEAGDAREERVDEQSRGEDDRVAVSLAFKHSDARLVVQEESRFLTQRVEVAVGAVAQDGGDDEEEDVGHDLADDLVEEELGLPAEVALHLVAVASVVDVDVLCDRHHSRLRHAAGEEALEKVLDPDAEPHPAFGKEEQIGCVLKELAQANGQKADAGLGDDGEDECLERVVQVLEGEAGQQHANDERVLVGEPQHPLLEAKDQDEQHIGHDDLHIAGGLAVHDGPHGEAGDIGGNVDADGAKLAQLCRVVRALAEPDGALHVLERDQGEGDAGQKGDQAHQDEGVGERVDQAHQDNLEDVLGQHDGEVVAKRPEGAPLVYNGVEDGSEQDGEKHVGDGVGDEEPHKLLPHAAVGLAERDGAEDDQLQAVADQAQQEHKADTLRCCVQRKRLFEEHVCERVV